MEVFIVTEPFYDVCESWAEEPSPQAWDDGYAEMKRWVLNLN